MVLFVNDPPRMDRNHMAARILDITLEIIHMITGEDYTVVNKSSGDCVTPCVSGGWSSTQSPITEPPPHSLIHEQKILDLTSRITELLTGEVPIRCQDVTVYFSMEEWEYLEGHKDLYKDVMMEDHQPLSSPDGSSRRNPPERCPSPLYYQDCPEEEQNALLDHRVLNVESFGGITTGLEKSVSVSVNGEDWMKGFHKHLLSPCYKVEENHFKNLRKSMENQSQIAKKRPGHRQGATHIVEKPFSCTECGKYFDRKSILVEHLRLHTGDKPNLCSECGKCYNLKSDLAKHQTTHSRKKPYSCSECGKSFRQKSSLGKHQIIHTGEKPFSCTECEKSFNRKSILVEHLRIHTGEKPYSCSECGRCFTHSSSLSDHLKIHTGEKPFPCPECGKCFSQKLSLVRHLRIHTGEKANSCTICGKGFSHKITLVKHLKTHTGKEQ